MTFMHDRPLAVHALDSEECFTLCGHGAYDGVICSEVRSDTTCKRCLASLAKRDRHFRARARTGLRRGVARLRGGPMSSRTLAWMLGSARAIALEEGRV